MTPSDVLFFLMGLSLWNKAEMNDMKAFVHHETSFISADVGGNVTLRCSHDSNAASYYWYKQALGQKPQLISMTYKLEKSGTFHKEFKDNLRFTLETEIDKSQLKISDLQRSDTGTYLCASSRSFLLTFGKGVTVIVKDSVLGYKVLVHQSESKAAQPGGSLTLNCTVETRICRGEHRVFWFRNSAENDPGPIYTCGGRKDKYGRNLNIQATCVCNLPMKNINKSHVGTYYCAVASNGQIVFGNGTKLELESEPVLVYILCAALIFTTILSALLAFILYKKRKSDCRQTSGNHYFCNGGNCVQVIHIFQ
ncbi:hypothetical protein GOODEAATRI_012143 [Goodea atripinnis]|uniref:Ig-like domain-containing protein n=1 Tax=Goodea atripinnis TaxID=208336 RepID=A0ABV0MH49_9TELE